MSIKGASGQILYVNKQKVALIGTLGKKINIFYENLDKIEYFYCRFGEIGFLDFFDKEGHHYRFNFHKSANDKIMRSVKLIKEQLPSIEAKELHLEDFKFYQRNWFILLLSFLCCAPIGLILMWYHKKNTPFFRTLVTGLYISYWLIGIFTLNKAFNTMQDAFSTIYTSNNQTLSVTAITDTETTISTDAEESPATEAYSNTLPTGHYIVGIDIPVGTYTISPKSGFGNIYTDDGTINTIFDAENSMDILTDVRSDKIESVFLDDGTVLSVLGNQEISVGCSDGLVSSMKSREQPDNMEEVEIGYGWFTSGIDFTPGTYDIIWIEGNGNIFLTSTQRNSLALMR